jgi:hypothetical protein
MCAKYHGRHGVVYMSTTGTGVATNVAQLTEWSIDMATDKVDVTAFGDGNKTYVQGLKDLSGSFSGFWNDAADTIYDAAASADGVKMYLYPSSDASGKYFYGPAWVDMSVSTSVSDAVKISGSFSANGTWDYK